MSPVAHLRPLTGLRFIAAFQVVAFHLAPRDGVPSIVRPLLEAGYVGVSLFYILSGFILAYTYSGAGPLHPDARRRFWQARFARIYPVYLFGLLVALPILVTWAAAKYQTESATLATVKVGLTAVSNIFLLQAWITSTIPQWNSLGWSLSCEAFFYTVFPFAAPRLHPRSHGGLLRTVLLLFVLAMVPPVAYMIAEPDGLHAVTHESWGAWLSVLKYNPLLRLPEFLLGLAIGRHFLLARPRSEGSTLVAIGLVAAVAMLLASERIPYVLLHNGLLMIPFAAIIYGLALGGGVVGRALALPAVFRLGEASYALYILHVPIVWWLARTGLLSGWAGFLALCVIAIVLSILVHRYVEEPLRKRLRPRAPASSDQESGRGSIGSAAAHETPPT